MPRLTKFKPKWPFISIYEPPEGDEMHEDQEPMVLAVDAVSGEIVFAPPSHPLFLANVDALVDFLDQIYAMVPKLRAATEATVHSGNGARPSRPKWELANWSVAVQKPHPDVDDEEQKERIAAATGWSKAKTRKELRKGFPVVLGSQLTLIDALNLQEAAELNGVTANISAASQ